MRDLGQSGTAISRAIMKISKTFVLIAFLYFMKLNSLRFFRKSEHHADGFLSPAPLIRTTAYSREALLNYAPQHPHSRTQSSNHLENNIRRRTLWHAPRFLLARSQYFCFSLEVSPEPFSIAARLPICGMSWSDVPGRFRIHPEIHPFLASMLPNITACPPAAIALAISPEYLIPPSAMTFAKFFRNHCGIVLWLVKPYTGNDTSCTDRTRSDSDFYNALRLLNKARTFARRVSAIIVASGNVSADFFTCDAG